MSELEKELAALLNKHSAENGSNTPDFILAEYLIDCLVAFDNAVKKRTSCHNSPQTGFMGAWRKW